MTENLYQLDSYIKEFEAKVIGVNNEDNSVVLDRSVFFPGGGGQPHDTGKLISENKEHNVVKVKKNNDIVYHFIEGNLPELNSNMQGQIDWGRRYKLMRTHTACHILCGVVWRDYKASVTGGNMEPLRGRLDFEFESLKAEFVKEIEEKLNEEVEKERDVRINLLPREEAFKIPDLIRTKINLLPESLKTIRTIEIDGLDLQADGGTHVANTKEVGIIKILKHKSKGKINKRIEIGLDE